MSFKSKIKTFLSSKNKSGLLLDFFYGRRIKKWQLKKLVSKVENSKPIFGVTPKIVVSLTSFHPRFEQLPKMLKSLLFQTVKPDRIIVLLDKNEKPTPEMLALQKYGVSYYCKDLALKPHKKYFYSLQEFESNLVITVDDDLIYPSDLIETLLKTWKKYPDCICARRVHKIIFNSDGSLKPYNDWQLEYTGMKEPTHELFATGVGGVLYPPHIFDEKVFDAEAIKEYCLEADDIWLKWHELRLGIKVVWAKNNMVHPPVIDGSQQLALSFENFLNNKNDSFIQNCQKKIFELDRTSLANLD